MRSSIPNICMMPWEPDADGSSSGGGTGQVLAPPQENVTGATATAVPIATVDYPEQIYVANPGAGQTQAYNLPSTALLPANSQMVLWVIPSIEADLTGVINIVANGTDGILDENGNTVGSVSPDVSDYETITELRYDAGLDVWQQAKFTQAELQASFDPVTAEYRIVGVPALQTPQSLATVTADYYVTSAAQLQVIRVNAAAAAKNVDFPNAPIQNQQVIIKVEPGSEFPVTLTDLSASGFEQHGNVWTLPINTTEEGLTVWLQYDGDAGQWDVIAYTGPAWGNMMIMTSRGFAFGYGDTGGDENPWIGAWKEAEIETAYMARIGGATQQLAWHPEYVADQTAQNTTARYKVQVVAVREDAAGYFTAQIEFSAQVTAGGVYTLLVDDDTATTYNLSGVCRGAANSADALIAADTSDTGSRPRVTFGSATGQTWLVKSFGSVTFMSDYF